MLARSRSLTLRSGARLETPLLIPSFSSRGFALRPDGLSEAATYLEVARNYLAEVILVSAYDLHHRLLPEAEELAGPGHWDTIWATPQLLIIDSGGYELGIGWDGSELRHDEREPLPFDRAEYERMVDQLPLDRDLLVVTWDHLAAGQQRPEYDSQVLEAKDFAGARPHLMVDMLLKPAAGSSVIRPAYLRQHAQLLQFADVIGVTEKELGETILDRATALASLRRVLDDEGVAAPIHVFGALDPLFVALYFTAGAELFDGLTWLRYGIYEGTGVYRDAAALLDGDYDSPELVRRAGRQLRYLTALAEHKRALRGFVESGGAFAVLGHHAGVIERAYRAMLSRMQETEGVWSGR
jgi:hypothetical protein